MRALLTDDSIRWLREHRIFFDFKGRARLTAGHRLRFAGDLSIEPYTGFLGGRTLCRMGFMSYSMSPVPSELTVGRYCSIGHDVDVLLDQHTVDHVTTAPITQALPWFLGERLAEDLGTGLPAGRPYVRRAAPLIENDVWIGAHANLLPGITIATGAVVAAGSVVTHDVRPYEIVAGNPARLVRSRFADAIVEMMLETEWWRYCFTDFRDLPFDKPAEFAEGFLKRKAELEPFAPAPVVMAEMPRVP